MFSRKVLLLLTILGLIIYACNNDDDNVVIEEFDHAAQAIIDNDTLVSFLNKHYFDDAVDSIRPIDAGQTALINDPRLFTDEVVENEIDYILYYFIKEQGNPDPVKGFPTVMDSVLTKYRGVYLKNTDTVFQFERNIAPTWFNLVGVIRGWSYGFTHYKGGRNITTDNGPINYENVGEGVLIMPSGLAYRNVPNNGIPANSPLIFYINLLDLVENTDHESDNVPSIMEDPDGDGDPRNDDTDGDLIPNYFDTDDDGDGVLTKDEDANGDGDPTNDFSDPNNPTLPDYLNPDYPSNT